MGAWSLEKTGNPDHYFASLEWIPSDTTFWLNVPVEFPAKPVIFTVGCENYHLVQLNDVSTHQTMDSEYYVEEVRIRR